LYQTLHPCVLILFKIVWNQQENENGEVFDFQISVDGTHCRINEPGNNPSSEWYSHKFHKAAVNYEIGIDLHSSKVVWVNGPFPAGQSDLCVYRKENGLRTVIQEGKKVIADNGYQSKDEINLSTPNPFDSNAVKQYKTRARARHESFNKRIKDFGILSERFRHGFNKHKIAFESVCVIVQ
jgi:DDE superfamily endonuclease